MLEGSDVRAAAAEREEAAALPRPPAGLRRRGRREGGEGKDGGEKGGGGEARGGRRSPSARPVGALQVERSRGDGCCHLGAGWGEGGAGLPFRATSAGRGEEGGMEGGRKE